MMATEAEFLGEWSTPTQPRVIFIKKPKKALTSYNLYFQALRQEMLKEQRVSGKKIGFAAMARTVASMWKVLDGSEKAHYELLAQQDKVRYAKEVSLWKKAKKTAASVKTIYGIREKDTQTLPAEHSTIFVRNPVVSIQTRCAEGSKCTESHNANARNDQQIQRNQQVPRTLSREHIFMVQRDSNHPAALQSMYHQVVMPPSSSVCPTKCLSITHDANLVRHTRKNQVSPSESCQSTEFTQHEAESRFNNIPGGLDFNCTHQEQRDVALSSAFAQGVEVGSEKNLLSSDTSIFDRANVSYQQGPPCAQMTVLADRMGSECAYLFLDIFRL